MELTFLGAVGTVTGSSYLLTSGNNMIMVDCGLYQGPPELEERNYAHPLVNWSEIDAILLTHAHIDHCGLIPRAVKLGFRGNIYAHPATVDLAQILLNDAADVQEHDSEWLSRKRKRAGKDPVEPLFTRSDVERAIRRFKRIEYEDKVNILPGVYVEFHDAGHILGSASIAVDLIEDGLSRRIVFSGDIGHHQAPILREPFGFENADAVIIESTYGDRNHEKPQVRLNILKDALWQADRNSSKLIIPSFAVGRAQEILYLLSEMLEKGEIPSIPIYLDSPMAISATEIHERHVECFDQETLSRIKNGENPFKPDTLHISKTVAQSRGINKKKGGLVIIAGSGMCEGGRVVHHLKHSLFDPNNHVLLVGYQAQGTLGRLLQDGVHKIKLLGEEIAVNAKITSVGAFSAHADRDGLIDWLGYLKEAPKIIITVHGEDKAAKALAEEIRVRLGYQTYLPRLNQQIDLKNLEEVYKGKRRILSQPLPRYDHLSEIIARIEFMGNEFRKMVEEYAAKLANRLAEGQKFQTETDADTRKLSEILSHLANVVGGDINKLNELMKSFRENSSQNQ